MSWLDKARTEQQEADIRVCPVCEKQHLRGEMMYTRDCQGIVFRLVCEKCWQKVMARGYDGQYYNEADECLDEDY